LLKNLGIRHAQVLIDDKIVCIADTVLGCAAFGRQKTYIDTLTIDLIPGAIRMTGDLRVTIASWQYVVPITAQWSVDIALRVDNAGSVSAVIGSPQVQLGSALTVLANFFSAGQLQTAVQNGVGNVFKAGLGGMDLSDLVRHTIDQLSRTGKTIGTGITPRVVRVDVRADGVVMHGLIGHSFSPQDPIVNLSAVASTTPANIVFGAGWSWSPGDDLIPMST
jgi:hypothetical protein